MADYKTYATKPIFFERNRVGRVYTGGKLFADFLGDEPVDGFLPEEWVASSVRAMNKGSTDPREGVSKIEGTDIYLDELIENCPREILGTRKSLDLLVKYLDSAVRLPVQAHPDKAFSRKYLNSNYGKTEMWVILATRPDAKIFYGFNRKISIEEFSDAVERSLTDKNCLATYLNEVPVKAGDVFLIPGKVAHAIGAGCLILEVQEPSDFIVQPEYWCEDYKLDRQQMYMDLTKEVAMGCFDYDSYGMQVVERGRMLPVVVSDDGKVRSEKLVNEEDGGCFSLYRHTIKDGEKTLDNGPAVYIVSSGEGVVCADGYSRKITKGNYFLLPASCKGAYKVCSESGLELMECLPPRE